MMDVQTVKKIVSELDYKVVQALELHIAHRMELAYKILETSTDVHIIAQAQGRVQELSKLKTLRDDCLAILKPEEDM